MIFLLSFFSLPLICFAIYSLVAYFRYSGQHILLELGLASLVLGGVFVVVASKMFPSEANRRVAGEIFHPDRFVEGNLYPSTFYKLKSFKPFKEHAVSIIVFLICFAFMLVVSGILMLVFYFIYRHQFTADNFVDFAMQLKLGRYLLACFAVTLTFPLLSIIVLVDYVVQLKTKGKVATGWILSKGIFFHLGTFYVFEPTVGSAKTSDTKKGMYRLIQVQLITKPKFMNVHLTVEKQSSSSKTTSKLVFTTPKNRVKELADNLKLFMEGYCNNFKYIPLEKKEPEKVSIQVE
eukprot:TRINITY_DN15595_c0_g1_i1.p1 TRINITY_DN15595_c0_g1~~TRINITY_DN15595_c0_g1_i1.p1  ORF type:complete len:339 (+),score=58.87 TRINITY_DN15595_c0_g1_i1:142-1017(+)